MQAEKTFQVAKVLRDKGQAVVIRQVSFRILILVEYQQPSCFIQLLQYRPTVSATAESAIHINSSRNNA